MDSDSDCDEELFYGLHDECDFSEQFEEWPGRPTDEYPHDDEENSSSCEFNFDNPHEFSNDGCNEFDFGDLPDDGSHFEPDFGDEDKENNSSCELNFDNPHEFSNDGCNEFDFSHFEPDFGDDNKENNSSCEFNFDNPHEFSNDGCNEFDFGDLPDDGSHFEPDFGDEDNGDVESDADYFHFVSFHYDDPFDFRHFIDELSSGNPDLHEDSSWSRSFNPRGGLASRATGRGPEGPPQQGFPWAPFVLEEKYFIWFISDNFMTVTKQPVSINENWFKGPVIILSTVIFVCQTVENVKRLHVGPSSQDKGTAKFQLALSRFRLVGELMSLQM